MPYLLLGNSPRSELPLDRFPTNREILKRYKFYRETLDDVDTRSNLVIELVRICEQLELEPQLDKNIDRQLKNLYNSYQGICKSKNNSNFLHQPNVIRFSATLDDVFDVSSQADPVVRRRKIRIEQFDRRRAKEQARQAAEATIYDYEALVSSICESEEDHKALMEDDAIVDALAELFDRRDPDFKKFVKSKVNVLSSNLLSSCDRAGVSSRDSMRIICDVLAQLDVNLFECTISYTTIWRHRQVNRTRIELEARESIDAIGFDHLTLHFDGVKLFDSDKRKFVEHLAVVVTRGDEFEQLISINRLDSGSADVITESIITELDKYQTLISKISALCHDTPNLNTGIHNGVAVQLIRFFKSKDKNVFSVPCRRHILELIISSVYIELFGKPSGPAVPLFVRFQKIFDRLNLDEPEEYEFHLTDETELLRFIDHQLSCNQKRADFYELLQLARMFISGEIIYPIKRPGADSQSRWMAKLIYGLKIYLFRSQLTSLNFVCSFSKLRDFCIFVVTIYLKSWFESSIPLNCVLNDLNLYKLLINIEPTGNNKLIQKASLNSFSNHLQYLTTELSSFALFDRRLSNETKEKMRFNMVFNKNQLATPITHTTQIEDLISTANLGFLRSLNINLDFLSVNVDQ